MLESPGPVYPFSIEQPYGGYAFISHSTDFHGMAQEAT